MRSTTLPEPLLLRVWTRVLWPPLAIPVAVVGLMASALLVGPWTMLVSLTALALVMWVSVWAVVRDLPGLRRRAFGLGVGTALVLVVMAGWTEISTQAGVVVPLLTAASSPPAMRLALHLARRRRRTRPVRPELHQRMLLDRELVDRRFEELVKDLEASGDQHDH